jgi:hypothetical protein
MNLVCYAFIILAYGGIVRSARLRTLFAALTFNIKPFAILAVAGRLARRDWVWIEWCGLWIVIISVVSFTIFGSGDPLALLRDLVNFSHQADSGITLTLIDFSTTYNSLLMLLNSPLPLTSFVGSEPVEILEHVLPALIKSGAVGVGICAAYIALRPAVCSRARISALVLVLFMTISTGPGGYAVEFALFFVFLERVEGAGQRLAVICAYLWCVPIDIPILTITHETQFSFLSQHTVFVERGLFLGQFLRPALLLIIEYGLVFASLGDIYRDLRARARVISDAGTGNPAARRICRPRPSRP